MSFIPSDPNRSSWTSTSFQETEVFRREASKIISIVGQFAVTASSFAASTYWDTAVHEAGHYLSARALGYHPTKVEIELNGNGATHFTHEEAVELRSDPVHDLIVTSSGPLLGLGFSASLMAWSLSRRSPERSPWFRAVLLGLYLGGFTGINLSLINALPLEPGLDGYSIWQDIQTLYQDFSQ